MTSAYLHDVMPGCCSLCALSVPEPRIGRFDQHQGSPEAARPSNKETHVESENRRAGRVRLNVGGDEVVLGRLAQNKVEAQTPRFVAGLTREAGDGKTRKRETGLPYRYQVFD